LLSRQWERDEHSLQAERNRSKTACRALFALALALYGPFDRFAFAAADPSGDLTRLDLEDLMKLEVTAAAKHPQSAADAPSSVTVITAEEIRRFGYRTLAEALRSVRGFYSSYDRNYGYVGVRGFLRPGDFNDRILLLVNGHTYNDDIYQQAYVDPTFGIDMEAIERIEIIRGPGSALYGGNALLAVINVVTATGSERPGVRPLAETGSFGRKRGQVSVGHVFEDGVDVFASGSVLDVDGPHELFYPELASPETSFGVARDADAERALSFFGSARYGNWSVQGGANTREKHVPTGSYGTTFGDSDTKTVDSRPFAELSYASTELLSDTSATARAYYDSWYYHGTYVIGSGPDRVKNEDVGSSHWGGAEIRLRREMFRDNALTVGSEYTYHPHAHQENFNLGGEKLLDDTRSFATFGIYGQDEWTVVPGVDVVVGGRFDRSYGGETHLSPRGALIWSPRPETRVKLLYGEAFRAANLYEQYYATPAVGFLEPAKLEPERMTTYEVAVEQELWFHAHGTVAVYHYEIDHLIDQTTVDGPDGTLLQFRNLGSARATGAEVELRVPLPGGISARAAYCLQDARAKGGRRLTNSPRHLASTAMLFPLPFGASAGAELLVVSPRLTLRGKSLETVTLANLTLTTGTGIPNLDFAAGLYNLLNQHYADPGGSEHRQDRIPQDRFTYRVQLSYRF